MDCVKGEYELCKGRVWTVKGEYGLGKERVDWAKRKCGQCKYQSSGN